MVTVGVEVAGFVGAEVANVVGGAEAAEVLHEVFGVVGPEWHVGLRNGSRMLLTRYRAGLGVHWLHWGGRATACKALVAQGILVEQSVLESLPPTNTQTN